MLILIAGIIRGDALEDDNRYVVMELHLQSQ